MPIRRSAYLMKRRIAGILSAVPGEDYRLTASPLSVDGERLAIRSAAPRLGTGTAAALASVRPGGARPGMTLSDSAGADATVGGGATPAVHVGGSLAD